MYPSSFLLNFSGEAVLLSYSRKPKCSCWFGIFEEEDCIRIERARFRDRACRAVFSPAGDRCSERGDKGFQLFGKWAGAFPEQHCPTFALGGFL